MTRDELLQMAARVCLSLSAGNDVAHVIEDARAVANGLALLALSDAPVRRPGQSDRPKTLRRTTKSDSTGQRPKLLTRTIGQPQSDNAESKSDNLSLSSEASSLSGQEKAAKNGEIGSGSLASDVAVQSAQEGLSDLGGAQSDNAGQPNRTTESDNGHDEQDNANRTAGPRSVRVAMADVWDGCGGYSVSGTYRHALGELEPLLTRLAAEQGLEPLELLRQAMGRFKSDESVRRKRLGLGTFISQFEQWCWPPVEGGNGRGPGEVSKTFDASQNPAWARGNHG